MSNFYQGLMKMGSFDVGIKNAVTKDGKLKDLIDEFDTIWICKDCPRGQAKKGCPLADQEEEGNSLGYISSKSKTWDIKTEWDTKVDSSNIDTAFRDGSVVASHALSAEAKGENQETQDASQVIRKVGASYRESGGQTFEFPSTTYSVNREYLISAIELYMFESGLPADTTMWWDIYNSEEDGVNEDTINRLATGYWLASEVGGADWYKKSFTPVAIDLDNQYFLPLYCSTGGLYAYFAWYYNTAAGYADGEMWFQQNFDDDWHLTGWDQAFRIYYKYRIYQTSAYITMQHDCGADVSSYVSVVPTENNHSGASISYQYRSSADASSWTGWTATLGDVTVQRYFEVKATFTSDSADYTAELQKLVFNYETTTTEAYRPTSLSWKGCDKTNVEFIGPITDISLKNDILTLQGKGLDFYLGESDRGNIIESKSFKDVDANYLIMWLLGGYYSLFEDDFNRTDDTDIGSDWVEEAADWEIKDNELYQKTTTAANGTTTTRVRRDLSYTAQQTKSMKVVCDFQVILSAFTGDGVGDFIRENPRFYPYYNNASNYCYVEFLYDRLYGDRLTAQLNLIAYDDGNLVINEYQAIFDISSATSDDEPGVKNLQIHIDQLPNGSYLFDIRLNRTKIFFETLTMTNRPSGYVKIENIMNQAHTGTPESVWGELRVDNFSIDQMQSAVPMGTINIAPDTSVAIEKETPRTVIRRICDSLSKYYRFRRTGHFDFGSLAELFSDRDRVYSKKRKTLVDEKNNKSSDEIVTGVLVLGSGEGTKKVAAKKTQTLGYSTLFGRTLKLEKVIEDSAIPDKATADQLAESYLSKNAEMKKAYRISVNDYNKYKDEEDLQIGDTCLFHNPDIGLEDTDNEEIIAGKKVNPIRLRVIGKSAPIDKTCSVFVLDGNNRQIWLNDYLQRTEGSISLEISDNVISFLDDDTEKRLDSRVKYPQEGSEV